MNFTELRHAFNSLAALRAKILQLVHLQGSIMSQAAACNRRHRVEARLAKWLLVVQDRAGQRSFDLTPEFMAQMIGTQNLTAGRTAEYLQSQGLITYKQGEVQILSRTGLEVLACNCYQTIRSLLTSLYKEGVGN